MVEYKNISFEKAKSILDNEPDSIIFDVREEEEYVTGHAEGAVCFPIDSINEETAKQMIPAKDTAVMVYCRSGSRSLESAQKLVTLGYERVYNIGSLVGWPYGMEWG
ncbi:MAG: rhodanese-like domain-containing protein [Faecalibacterium sp.]|nr:rhodanese-like domain-containing protein [Ruminococcus sp.]MCM1391980.1 rhodanese-like domain-containing protein [Ruminococcus sp.]MCM1485589.1 rhodanese-like domain-containing protein [Faecalibacterium sp.]